MTEYQDELKLALANLVAAIKAYKRVVVPSIFNEDTFIDSRNRLAEVLKRAEGLL